MGSRFAAMNILGCWVPRMSTGPWVLLWSRVRCGLKRCQSMFALLQWLNKCRGVLYNGLG